MGAVRVAGYVPAAVAFLENSEILLIDVAVLVEASPPVLSLTWPPLVIASVPFLPTLKSYATVHFEPGPSMVAEL